MTVENYQVAKERLTYLKRCPAAVRFVSYEPALGPIDFSSFEAAFDWLIGGGESGAHARPFNPQWALAARDACRDMGIPFFFKQWGGNRKIEGAYGGIKLEGQTYHEFPSSPLGHEDLASGDAN